MNKNIRNHAIPVVITILTFILGFFFYGRFPGAVPTHWGTDGTVNGYSSRTFAAFGLPVIILGMYILFNLLPFIDPKHNRYVEFERVYKLFVTLIISFLALVYVVVGLNGIGYGIRVEVFIPLLIGVLFILLGWYLNQVKSNWFIGIRNPWTLSREDIWNKSHRLGRKTFMLGGVLMIISAFVNAQARIWLFVIAIIIAAVVPNVYSLILFLQDRDRQN
jgi:uncharacterized membrane protein